MCHVSLPRSSLKSHVWVMSHMYLSRETHARLTYESSMSHIWTSRISLLRPSLDSRWLTCVTASLPRVTWLIHTCNITHSYVWCCLCVCHRLIHMRDMTHSYVCHDPCITWLTLMSGVTHTCDIWMSRTSLLRPSLESHVWVMSHMYMSHVSHVLSRNTRTCLTCECGMSHIWMSHISLLRSSLEGHGWVVYVTCLIYEWVVSHVSRLRISHILSMNEACLK